jgi:hypothetical protein
MTTATLTATTTTNNHKEELRQWLDEFSTDYFRNGDAAKIVRGAAYRATERALNPQGTARTEKQLSTTTTTRGGKVKARTTMSRNAPTWSKRANKCSRHVPLSTIYDDSQNVAAECWGYLCEFVNLVEFTEENLEILGPYQEGEDPIQFYGPANATWSLEWKRSKRTKRIFRRSGNLGNLHRVLIWAGISAAINEKKSQDIRNSELRSYDSDESLELVAHETLHSLDFNTIAETIFKPARPKNQSKEELRLTAIENKRREDKRAKLSRQLGEIVEKKISGEPLTSGERVLLFKLRKMVPQESFEEILCRVENVKMHNLAFIRGIPIVDESRELRSWLESRDMFNHCRPGKFGRGYCFTYKNLPQISYDYDQPQGSYDVPLSVYNLPQDHCRYLLWLKSFAR